MATTAIHWSASTQYVDADTGEMLTKYQALSKQYYKYKTTSHVTYNYNRTKGHKQYTILVKRKPQREIDFNT